MDDETHKAILDLTGATCTSCVYTIEHVGKRIKGVKDINVDRGAHEIQLEYDGSPDTINTIISIVQRIGYDAQLRRQENA